MIVAHRAQFARAIRLRVGSAFHACRPMTVSTLRQLPTLCFHEVTNCFFPKPFLFTTIRIAPGCGSAAYSPLSTRDSRQPLSPLFVVLTQNAPASPLDSALTKNARGMGIPNSLRDHRGWGPPQQVAQGFLPVLQRTRPISGVQTACGQRMVATAGPMGRGPKNSAMLGALLAPPGHCVSSAMPRASSIMRRVLSW